MKGKYILAIDQGTTSSRIVVLDEFSHLIKMYSHNFEQIYQDNEILQDANLIYEGVKRILDEAINDFGIENIHAIGITNQRETTVIFNKKGEPLDYSISWQSKHTQEICDTWKTLGYEPYIKAKTGLEVNAYFSASKMVYFLNKPELKKTIEKKDALFGTMDTYILYRLTQGKSYYTDVTNASRTMLLDITTATYDEKLLSLFKIPLFMLPEVKPNKFDFGFYKGIPIKAMIGDQQSALFGHLAFEKGTMKVTYGTGAFILMNTGVEMFKSETGLITTIAYKLNDEIYYAIEGSIFVAGSSVKWLRDKLMIIKTSKESEDLARKSKRRIYFVPAFVGLGAPYWDTDVRGSMFGITEDTTKYDIIKATLDAIAFQVKDVVDVMIKESKTPLERVYIDGGASDNNYLMQFQSDLLRCPLVKPKETEITALGVGFLAGLGSLYKDISFIKENQKILKKFMPLSPYKESLKDYEGWKKAVKSARTFK
ncbi:MAG: glycerol kinase GlpK [Acholeplasmataceae bacterium]|nr:glycerol kinase GlpK [Acholeplasmataceae bacterium]